MSYRKEMGQRAQEMSALDAKLKESDGMFRGLLRLIIGVGAQRRNLRARYDRAEHRYYYAHQRADY